MIKYDDLIGAPFKYGARGEDGYYDCFGALYECYRRKGTPLPDFPSTKDLEVNAKAIFEALSERCQPTKLKAGAILCFKIKRFAGHLGMYLGNDEFIHSWEGAGMIVTERLSGAWSKRLVGVYELKD